jgi:tetratricopeptide (TPR) repeat protein
VPESKEKAKKDAYHRSLAAYEQAMKAFRKGDCDKASELFKDFLKKHTSEKEFTDRAKMYLSMCEDREKKDTVPLKTSDDYYQFAVYRLNQGEYEQALNLLEKAKEKAPKEGRVLYLKAITYCLMGEEDSCLDNLKEAIHKDKFFRILARNESDFESLWENKKFKLITRVA